MDFEGVLPIVDPLERRENSVVVRIFVILVGFQITKKLLFVFLQGKNFRERQHGLIDHRSFGIDILDFLFEIADRKTGRRDRTLIRCYFSGNQSEECGLSGAVRSYKSDATRTAYRPVDILEDRSAAKGNRYVVELNDGSIGWSRSRL